jgi:alpha-amylase
VQRFAPSDAGSASPCNNYAKWCGGDLKGIIEMLDYVKGMGFDAVWISPISDQTTGPGWENPVGYHGE